MQRKARTEKGRRNGKKDLSEKTYKNAKKSKGGW